MLYYGDEFGMPGAGDPDNRRFMQWDNHTAHQTWLRDRLAALAKIRHEHLALRRGTRQTIGVSYDALVYKMTAAGDTVFVALNRGDTQQGAPSLPAGNYVDLISGATVSAPLMLAPRTALVLAPQ
jgi:glycosidase